MNKDRIFWLLFAVTLLLGSLIALALYAYAPEPHVVISPPTGEVIPNATTGRVSGVTGVDAGSLAGGIALIGATLFILLELAYYLNDDDKFKFQPIIAIGLAVLIVILLVAIGIVLAPPSCKGYLLASTIGVINTCP